MSEANIPFTPPVNGSDKTIISSTKIHGFNSAHFVLTEDIDSETLTIFNASTSGTVQLPS